MYIMEKYSITDLSLFVASIVASLSALLAVVFKSKCSEIKCCCVECKRPQEAIMKDIAKAATPRP
jgi:hypothetical protein